MLNLLLVNDEALLHAQLVNSVHLVSFEQGLVKIRLRVNSDNEIIKKLLMAINSYQCQTIKEIFNYGLLIEAIYVICYALTPLIHPEYLTKHLKMSINSKY